MVFHVMWFHGCAFVFSTKKKEFSISLSLDFLFMIGVKTKNVLKHATKMPMFSLLWQIKCERDQIGFEIL